MATETSNVIREAIQVSELMEAEEVIIKLPREQASALYSCIEHTLDVCETSRDGTNMKPSFYASLRERAEKTVQLL